MNLRKKAQNNKKSILIYTPIHVIARKTNSEADEFHDFYSNDFIDEVATKNFIKNVAVAGKKSLYKIMLQKNLIASSCGSKIIKGSYKDVREQLNELKNANFDGAAFSFVNYY